MHTLRYYERIGFIAPVNRAIIGHRRYTDADLEWIGFLKKLRTTGMPIAKMKEFVELTRRGDGAVVERRALLEEHDRAVERAIEELSENRGTNLQKYGATASHHIVRPRTKTRQWAGRCSRWSRTSPHYW